MTLKVEDAVKGEVPLPMMMSEAEKVAAPVPPLTMERVVVAVAAELPLP
jgi:hypothetical protein